MSKFKQQLHHLFVHFPNIGRLGYTFYDFIFVDHELRKFLRNLQNKGFSPGTILDIGANRGAWSKNVLPIFPEAEYHLIEPQLEMEPFLQHFCLGKNCSYSLACAGPQEGEADLGMYSDFTGSSILVTKDEKREFRTVPVIAVDYLVESNRICEPSIIKLDVQGYELEALKGSLKSLGKCELIIMEVSTFEFRPGTPLLADVIEFMKNIDFVVYEFLNIKKRPFDGVLGQLDIAFVKTESEFRNSQEW